MTQPTLIKVTVLAAVAAGLGGLGFTELRGHHALTPIPVAAPLHHSRVPAARPRHTAAAPTPASTLPAPLRQALTGHGVVVAVLYAPGVPGDAAAVEAAREGARNAHVGFAKLNVRDEAVAKALALKLPGSSDPSVLVVTRPGTIVTLLAGYADRAIVVQAARDAA
ncbi:MAG TPA: hypothetical protein VG652_02410 [Gaiellaceae bacterium]|nr:hypothetical protein [Gaiellaceae bacterium]